MYFEGLYVYLVQNIDVWFLGVGWLRVRLDLRGVNPEFLAQREPLRGVFKGFFLFKILDQESEERVI